MKIIRERDGGRCRRCGSTRALECDHIVPIARGGGASPDNGQLLCHDCHRLKNALDRAITQCLTATLQLAEALVEYLTAIAQEEEDGHHRHAA